MQMVGVRHGCEQRYRLRDRAVGGGVGPGGQGLARLPEHGQVPGRPGGDRGRDAREPEGREGARVHL